MIDIPFSTIPGPPPVRFFLGGRPVTAAEMVTAAFTRSQLREAGFHRRIMPAVRVSRDELDRAVDTDLPVRIVDMEPAP